MTDLICVDLTSPRPAAYWCEGKVEPIWPVFCLPWVQGEPVLVHEVAKRHRRSSMLDAWEHEALLTPGRRGRFHLGEGWSLIGKKPDSTNPSNAVFSWKPEGKERVEVPFPEVIKAVLGRWASSERALALIVPDGLGPGPRQEILDQISGDFQRVELVPRTIAAAVNWCQSEEASGYAETIDREKGEHVAYLVVSTTAMDSWEAAVVPIRVEGKGTGQDLCPVHARVHHGSEIGLIGLWQWSPGSPPSSSNGKTDRWAPWLLRGDKTNRKPNGPEEVLANLAAYKRWAYQGWTEPENCVEEIERTIREKLQSSIPTWWIHVSGTNQQREPEHGFEFLNQLGLCCDNVSDHVAILRGGFAILKLILAGRIPYFESLARVDLFTEGINEFLDPTVFWRPLVEEGEVPAGKVYRSPCPIRDIALKAGDEQEVDLLIRSNRRGGFYFGQKKVHETVSIEADEPLQISAQMRPGQGLLRFDIESSTPGLFSASVRESETKVIQEPKMTYSWPPGSAWVIAHPDLSKKVMCAFEDLASIPPTLATSRELKFVRDLHNSWKTRQATEKVVGRVNLLDFNYPRDLIAEEFVWFGAFSSSDRMPSGDIADLTRRYGDFLVRVHHSTYDIRARKGAAYSASWLQIACPEYFLIDSRKGLCEGNVSDSQLAVVGQCFHQRQDYKIFFDSLVDAIEGNYGPEDKYWLRAYRNLIRFREDALQLGALNREGQNLIMRWYVARFRDAINRRSREYLMQCSYLAPHVLKRRRFDREFLSPQYAGYRLFKKVLQDALYVLSNAAQMKHVEVALDMLDHKGTEVGLRSLASTTS